MAKQVWKPGNMIYPVPAVMVSVGNKAGKTNIFTVAWTGTICTNPPMAYISVRPERYSYEFIMETGEFVINLTTKELAHATDFCGVRSGRDIDKWQQCKLTAEPASKLEYAPLIKESPVNIECKVRESKNYGSHTLFIADVVSVNVDDSCLDETGKADLAARGMITYSHGDYAVLGEKVGSFGYSVRKKPAAKKKTAAKKKPAAKKKTAAKKKSIKKESPEKGR